MPYEAVIGLEVHVQLNTKAKIFCSCTTNFTLGANTQVCQICQGHPGVLPVLNQAVVEKATQVAVALHCQIQKESRFDRKHYFYPDLPKGYQITQYYLPFCLGGYVETASDERIAIHRIHIEEDAGKLLHLGPETWVDFNRCGVPLLEIVSEPDIRSGEQAVEYLNVLKATLIYIDASNCNMEEGSLRCDVNISLRQKDSPSFGTKVEIKNLNSFKSIKKAIDFEIKRQSQLLDSGETIIQETRLYNMDEEKTASMRTKEEAQDYRYLPEPDLLPLYLDDETIQQITKELVELPKPRLERFIGQYGLEKKTAVILTSQRELADYFEAALKFCPNACQRLANWVIGDFLGVLNRTKKPLEELPVPPENLSKLVQYLEEKQINYKMAKDIFQKMCLTGKSPTEVIEETGLVLLEDEKILGGVIQAILDENPKAVASYKKGKTQVVGFLLGKVMHKTKGQANPKKTETLLLKRLPK